MRLLLLVALLSTLALPLVPTGSTAYVGLLLFNYATWLIANRQIARHLALTLAPRGRFS